MRKSFKEWMLAGLLSGTFLFFAGLLGNDVYAAPLVEEQALNGSGTLTSVSITTDAWITTTSTLGGRSGIKVNNLSTNNASIAATCGTAVPGNLTDYDIEIQTGENPFIPCANNLNLYLLSLHTAAETIKFREYKQ